MPSKSKAPHNLMALTAHDAGAAKRLGVPRKVAKEFLAADSAAKAARRRRKK